MSTFSWMSAPDISSDAAFRKWAQGVHDAFVGCGWVQTADTGQVTISTMTVPATADTAAGYEIFRMADTLQSSCPIFVKVEYGRGALSSTNIPRIWFTVGQSTNGSGTVAGVLLARTVQSTSVGATAGTTSEYASYASCAGNAGICIAAWPAMAAITAPFFFAIERSRDAEGAPTSDGLLIAFGCNSNPIVRVIGNGGSPGSVKCADAGYFSTALPYTVNGANASNTSTLSEDGVTAPILPIACTAPGVPPWASTALVAVHPGDAGSTSVIQAATINGAEHIYRAWTAFNSFAGLVAAGQRSASPALCLPAIIWEP
ncbi:MAG: hypothetical protein NVV70_16830 [Cellulomonas sp.]|nr:hypothetical protein [Cellulomonas sp.]MCR6649711.1 hypothetical protein [Cellulomonas sp.]